MLSLSIVFRRVLTHLSRLIIYLFLSCEEHAYTRQFLLFCVCFVYDSDQRRRLLYVLWENDGHSLSTQWILMISNRKNSIESPLK